MFEYAVFYGRINVEYTGLGKDIFPKRFCMFDFLYDPFHFTMNDFFSTFFEYFVLANEDRYGWTKDIHDVPDNCAHGEFYKGGATPQLHAVDDQVPHCTAGKADGGTAF